MKHLIVNALYMYYSWFVKLEHIANTSRTWFIINWWKHCTYYILHDQ